MKAENTAIYEFGEFRLDAAKRLLFRADGEIVPLTPKVFETLLYLVRNGKPWGACGTFVVSNASGSLTLKLNAPYSLEPGDSWIVTRAPFGGEPGKTVLRPVSI